MPRVTILPTGSACSHRAGLRRRLCAKLASEVARITSEPEFRDSQFIQRGLVPAVSTPEEFAAFIVRDRPFAERIVRNRD